MSQRLLLYNFVHSKWLCFASVTGVMKDTYIKTVIKRVLHYSPFCVPGRKAAFIPFILSSETVDVELDVAPIGNILFRNRRR
jgi:hypothetical protein